jgi:hypothetical protein
MPRASSSKRRRNRGKRAAAAITADEEVIRKAARQINNSSINSPIAASEEVIRKRSKAEEEDLPARTPRTFTLPNETRPQLLEDWNAEQTRQEQLEQRLVQQEQPLNNTSLSRQQVSAGEEVIRRKLRTAAGEINSKNHSPTAAGEEVIRRKRSIACERSIRILPLPNETRPQLLEDWNAVQSRQQQEQQLSRQHLNSASLSRQQMLSEMIHPSRRAIHGVSIPGTQQQHHNELAPVATHQRNSEWSLLQRRQQAATATAETVAVRHHDTNDIRVAQGTNTKNYDNDNHDNNMNSYNASRGQRIRGTKIMKSRSVVPPPTHEQQQQRKPSTRVAALDARKTWNSCSSATTAIQQEGHHVKCFSTSVVVAPDRRAGSSRKRKTRTRQQRKPVNNNYYGHGQIGPGITDSIVAEPVVESEHLAQSNSESGTIPAAEQENYQKKRTSKTPQGGHGKTESIVPEPIIDCEDLVQSKSEPGTIPATEQDTHQCFECTYIPHPSAIEAVVCCECGKEKSARHDIAWFDELCQGFLRDRHSLRISAMLDERSRTLIEPLFMADDAGDDAVSSRERRITLVDGLMEWSIQSTSLLVDIQQAIQRTPALQITSSYFIPTTRQEVQLLVVDLRPELALARVLFQAAQSSLVAQSPLLRFTCGLVSSPRGGGGGGGGGGASPANAITAILNSLAGSSLFLDPGTVASQSAS